MKEPGVEIIPAVPSSDFPVPAIIAAAGDKASEHFLEFFAATIRNKNTRAAYMIAIAQFCGWCQDNGLQLSGICPLHVSAYIESKEMSPPSIKQHLAALRGLFNWLVIKQVVPDNPALFVKGPKFSRRVGITPIMEAEQMRQLLDSIPIMRKVKIPRKHGGGHKEVADIKGLRDRAAIAIMAYTFARVSAVVGVKLGDYRLEGKRARLRLMDAGMSSWCKEFGERHGMQIDCRHDMGSTLPPEIGLCLFRVLQEALHNAAKHSGVKRIEVQLREDSGEIHLIVRDSGRGFEIEAARHGRGLGLTSMQERVRLVNGTILIESKPMGGTTIHVRVPLESGHNAQRAAG